MSFAAQPRYLPQLPRRDACDASCETIAGCTCTRLPGPQMLPTLVPNPPAAEARELPPDVGWREWGDAATQLGALLDQPAAAAHATPTRGHTARLPGARPPIITAQMRARLAAAFTGITRALQSPLRSLHRAVQRRLLAWEIRSALDEVELIDHYAELDPMRRRLLLKQVGAMRVRLIQLNEHAGSL